MAQANLVRRGRRFVRYVALVLLVGVTFFPSLAAAQQGEPQTVTRARQLYQQGVSAFDAQNYAEAERLLRESYQTHPHPVTLRNLAAALERLERRAEACNELARLIRVHPTADEKENAQRTLENLSDRVGRIAIQVSVTGADVKIDDKWVGVSPLPVWYVEPGEHTVSASKQGFNPATATATVAANEEKPVELSLTPTETRMPGAGLGTGPDPGANGGVSSDGAKPKTIALIAGAGLTAVALGVGIVFGLDHASAESDADDLSTKLGPSGCTANPNSAECVELRDKRDQASDSGQLATIGFIGAGVFGAATIATFFLWPDEPERSAARTTIAPSFGKMNGLTISGSF